jgi:uncharacterized delta-60 repeat protein
MSRKTLAAAACALLALAAPAQAADGDLDPTFGTGGVRHLPFGDSAEVAVQPDGKVVAVGGDGPGSDTPSYLARLTASGDLDPTFAGDGVAILSAPGGVSARDVAIQPDGRILVAGIVEPEDDGEGIVFRLTSGGEPDPAFDGDGRATFDFADGHSSPRAMQLQPDGRIVVGGTFQGEEESDFGVARLMADGGLDTSFAGDGTTTVDRFESDQFRTVTLQGDRIVATGFSEQFGAYEWVALRLMPDGSRDMSFGYSNEYANGMYYNGEFDGFDAVATPGGGVLFGGNGPGNPAAALELDGSGREDREFGGLDGYRSVAFGDASSSLVTGVGIGADGNYALVGSAYRPDGVSRLAAAKLTPGGEPVPSFGDGGSRVYDSADEFTVRDLAVAPDGKLVVGGNDGGSMVVARIIDASPPAPPGPQQPPAPARPPRIELTAGAPAVEGQPLTFTATLSRASDQPVSFNYVTGEGSAATGRDFGGRRGSVTIPAGQRSAQIAIPTNEDRLFETEELFRVELYEPRNATFGEYVAFGTILNKLRSGRCQNIVLGRKGTDVLTGSAAGDLIVGRQDVDFLFGLGGADCIRGERGGDIIDAGDGDDVVDGGSGDDRMRGGDGDDRLYGRRGRNRYNGGAGDDAIYARNGVAETVECGPGRDRVKADSRDRLRRCERVSR